MIGVHSPALSCPCQGRQGGPSQPEPCPASCRALPEETKRLFKLRKATFYVNTDERPLFSKGENSKQPGNRREIKRSPPCPPHRQGQSFASTLGFNYLGDLKSCSKLCQSPSGCWDVPSCCQDVPSCCWDVPPAHGGSQSPHPEPQLQHQPWQHLTPCLGSLKAHRNNQLGVHCSRGLAWWGSCPTAWSRGGLQKWGRISSTVQGGLGRAVVGFETFPTPLQSLSTGRAVSWESDSHKRSSWQQIRLTKPLGHQVRRSTRVHGDAQTLALLALGIATQRASLPGTHVLLHHTKNTGAP